MIRKQYLNQFRIVLYWGFIVKITQVCVDAVVDGSYQFFSLSPPPPPPRSMFTSVWCSPCVLHAAFGTARINRRPTYCHAASVRLLPCLVTICLRSTCSCWEKMSRTHCRVAGCVYRLTSTRCQMSAGTHTTTTHCLCELPLAEVASSLTVSQRGLTSQSRHQGAGVFIVKFLELCAWRKAGSGQWAREVRRGFGLSVNCCSIMLDNCQARESFVLNNSES